MLYFNCDTVNFIMINNTASDYQFSIFELFLE
jgi:hypothetical protein